MVQTSIAGTYFTVWEFDVANQQFQLGPIVVVGTDNSVVVDGVTMQGVVVSGASVAWFSALGNPSSALLQFSNNQGATFQGKYWLSEEEQPPSSNINGFNTQPEASLESWNNTYHCYENGSGTNQPAGELILSSPNVTFAGKAIINPVYTGLSSNGTDTNELAWFTSDGNDDNVAISFFSSSSQPGVQLFNGDVWAAGENRPVGLASAANNFFGTTQDNQNDDVNAVDNEAGEGHQALTLAMAALVQVAMINANAEGEGANVNNAADEEAAAAQDAAQNVNANAAPAAEEAAPAVEEAAPAAEEAAPAAEEAAPEVEEVTETLLEAALGTTEDRVATSPPRHSSKRPTGLSAKELLQLKNRS